MSEERLQEIKDSIEFQYTLAKAKGYDNALLFTNEEEELVEEIERLNNIIKGLDNTIENLNEVVKHKDNIINELEQWLEEQKHFIINTPSYTEKIKVEHKIMFKDYENVLIKIEELKGSDKE